MEHASVPLGSGGGHRHLWGQGAGVRLGMDISSGGYRICLWFWGKWAECGQEEGGGALNYIEQGMGMYFWVSERNQETPTP